MVSHFPDDIRSFMCSSGRKSATRLFSPHNDWYDFITELDGHVFPRDHEIPESNDIWVYKYEYEPHTVIHMANADKGDVAKMMQVPILLIDDSIPKIRSFLQKAPTASEAILIQH